MLVFSVPLSDESKRIVGDIECRFRWTFRKMDGSQRREQTVFSGKVHITDHRYRATQPKGGVVGVDDQIIGGKPRADRTVEVENVPFKRESGFWNIDEPKLQIRSINPLDLR